MVTRIRLVTTVGLFVGMFIGIVLSQQRFPDDVMERFLTLSTRAETEGLRDAFVGVTATGDPVGGLFSIRSTGVSTEPVQLAAEAFLGLLSESQREKTLFSIDDPEWRKWMNQHFYLRQGVGFDEMSDAQREAVFGLLRASLSARGL